MARPRKRTLELRKGGWFARITVTVPGCSPERRWVPLGTSDRGRAERLVERMVADLESGRSVAEAKRQTARRDTVDDFAETFFKRREALGVAMVRDERAYYGKYIQPMLGPLLLDAVGPRAVRAVVGNAVDQGLAKGSVVHIRGLLSRLFKMAWQDELIAENPVARVAVPKMRRVTKAREILTDDEIDTFSACPDVDLELRVMSLVARMEGGMRSGDINQWEWSFINTDTFASCTVPRAKTGVPEEMGIPERLRPALRAWWKGQGSPSSGPVFPVRRGKRKGDHRVKRGTSYARRLRRDLLRAGVKRHACTRAADAPAVRVGEACCANMARDPLYAETASTLPVDFHSFRRAFNTGLAAAGVNVQQAMHLAGHSDAKVHMKYVMRTAAMKAIPEAALPKL